MTGHAVIGGQHVCDEPLDALCRAVWDCQCEWYYDTQQQPDGTWTHLGQAWDDEIDDRATCRSHLQTKPMSSGRCWCNVVEWIDCQGRMDSWLSGEEYPGVWSHLDLELPDGPIFFEWGDEWLSWDYAAATPELGRFIAQYVVQTWADDRGLEVASDDTRSGNAGRLVPAYRWVDAP